MTPSTITVEITIDEPPHPDACVESLIQAVVVAADLRGYCSGQIGIRICDDATIRGINHRHLEHDYATDVISFGYTDEPPLVEGELVVSVETAERTASRLPGWSTQNELILYVVHGVLHICSMDDTDEVSRADMRAAERAVLTRLGIADISKFGADEAETCENEVKDAPWEIN